MSLIHQNILQIRVTTSSREVILEEIKKYLFHTSKKKPNPLVVTTPNSEQIVLAQKNRRFADVLNKADVALPDGIGPVWALRLLGSVRTLDRISGVDFMGDLVGLAEDQGV